MHEIKYNNLKDYQYVSIFKYQFFQIQEVDPTTILTENKAISFYTTIELAKQRQVYELHKLMTGTYKSKDAKEHAASKSFSRFVDDKDVDFFVCTITKGQMYEKEYFEYINQVEEEFPEKLI